MYRKFVKNNTVSIKKKVSKVTFHQHFEIVQSKCAKNSVQKNSARFKTLKVSAYKPQY